VTPPRIDPGTVHLVAERINHYITPGPRKICITLISLPYPYVFVGIKSVNGGILAIAEEHIHPLDKCVSM
jgi:hypothetical protein